MLYSVYTGGVSLQTEDPPPNGGEEPPPEPDYDKWFPWVVGGSIIAIGLAGVLILSRGKK